MTAIHRSLGYAGLIPFIGLSLYSLTQSGFAYNALIAYAALIFSFLGGLLWQLSYTQQQIRSLPWVGVTCSLWAWCWLLIPFEHWAIPAGASFIALWQYEERKLEGILSDDTLMMRKQLSVLAALSLLLAGLLKP